MDMSDLSWSAFIETGRVSAYLIHKNIKKRGGTRNAGDKPLCNKGLAKGFRRWT